MSVNEELRADNWLTQYLGNDVTLAGLISGVYSEMIPQNELLPAVRFHVQAQGDTRAAAGHRILINLLYLVVVTGEGPSVAPLIPIADRLDTLLHRDDSNRLTTAESGLVSGIHVLSTLREATWSNLERTDQGQFRHIGGLYRLIVQSP